MYFFAYWKRFRKPIDKGLKFLAVFIIGFYRIIIKGLLGGGGGCRFYPSCGDYALQAYEKHPFFEATQRIIRRLLSCHPFGFVGSFDEKEGGKRQGETLYRSGLKIPVACSVFPGKQNSYGSGDPAIKPENSTPIGIISQNKERLK